MRRRDSKKFLGAVGKKLHSLRIGRNLEIKTVANALGLCVALLLKIERGDYDMYIDQLFEFCEYYRVTPRDFFKDMEEDLKKG